MYGSLARNPSRRTVAPPARAAERCLPAHDGRKVDGVDALAAWLPARRPEPLRRALLALLVTAIAVPLAPPSRAAEPGETPIDATFTWTARELSKVIDADGVETYVSETFVVLTHRRSPKETRPFPDLGGRCIGSGTSDPTTFGYTLSGMCELRDADGDTLFERFEESSAGNGAPGIGSGEITGGTGKFAGVTGRHDYETRFYASPADGVYQGIGHKEGAWRLPAS